MMADLQALFQAVDELTADELKQLYLYIMQTRVQFAAAPDEILSKQRILGLFENMGETWVSDDFNDELPDSFWLGENES
jgi:hypothetical protein